MKSGLKICLKKIGIDPSFEKPKSRRKKVMPGEVCRDEAVTDPEKNFKVDFFYPVHDTCWLQMES